MPALLLYVLHVQLAAIPVALVVLLCASIVQQGLTTQALGPALQTGVLCVTWAPTLQSLEAPPVQAAQLVLTAAVLASLYACSVPLVATLQQLALLRAWTVWLVLTWLALELAPACSVTLVGTLLCLLPLLAPTAQLASTTATLVSLFVMSAPQAATPQPLGLGLVPCVLLAATTPLHWGQPPLQRV